MKVLVNAGEGWEEEEEVQGDIWGLRVEGGVGIRFHLLPPCLTRLELFDLPLPPPLFSSLPCLSMLTHFAGVQCDIGPLLPSALLLLTHLNTLLLYNNSLSSLHPLLHTLPLHHIDLSGNLLLPPQFQRCCRFISETEDLLREVRCHFNRIINSTARPAVLTVLLAGGSFSLLPRDVLRHHIAQLVWDSRFDFNIWRSPRRYQDVD